MTDEKPAALICTYECEIPSIGAWKVGDVVSDPTLVRLLTGHPYFKPTEGPAQPKEEE